MRELQTTSESQPLEILAKYELVVSATLDWISLVDRHYIYRIVNQTYLNWYQKSWDEIVGHSVSEVVGEDAFQIIKPHLDRCLAGEIVKYELEIEGNSFGNPEFVSATYTPFRELNGEISGVVVNVRDISDRKRSEIALRESEERWQLALEGNKDGIWDQNLITNKTFLSHRWLEITGYEYEDINTYERWLSFVHPDDLLLLQNSIEQYFNKEVPYYSVQYRIKCKDDSYKWLESRGKAIWDEQGHPVRMVGSITDISDRKQIKAELHQLNCELELKVNQRTEALRRSEAILQEAQAIANLGNWEIDLTTGSLRQSPEIFYILGINPEQQLSYAQMREYFNPDDWENLDRLIDRAIHKGLAYEIDLRFMRADGTSGVILAKGKPILNDQGQVTRLIGVVMDISDRKAAETQLKQQAEQQANLYQQLQTELAEKETFYLQLTNELHQKKVLLKEVHHRVKNNLQVMSSLLRMQFRKATPELKNLVADYQNRIQSMALIHAQLHQNEDLAHINFRDYISDLTNNLFHCYAANFENIKYKLDVDDIFLPLDQSVPLGLIINELISNTLKHAFPNGFGEVNVELMQVCDRYHLLVSDNGVGIPKDLDLENTDSLGMQLVYSLTDQIEGVFTYSVSNGSRFLLDFPIIN